MDVLKKWHSRLENELTGNIVPFWQKYSIDREFGGFLTCLERDGLPYDTLKQMWMQWREVYMFAALYNSRFGKAEYLDTALSGFDFLCRYGRKSDGGFVYMLDRQGGIIAEKADGAEVFSGSFAAVAAAELYRALPEKRFADEAFSALTSYRQAVVQNHTAYERLAHSMIELNVLTIMQQVFPDRISRGEIDVCIEKIFRFYHPEMGIFFENAPVGGGFDLASQEGRFTNPGHALEGLSFILEEFRLRENADDPLVKKFLPLTLSAVKTSFAYGWDNESGGIWYFKDALGKPVAKNEFMLKAWWPQNEAATAVLRAYEASGEVEFAEMFDRVENFCWENLRDPEFPEWFAYAAVDGRQFHTCKGSRFKGFFHIPRHLLNCIEILDRTVSKKGEINYGS